MAMAGRFRSSVPRVVRSLISDSLSAQRSNVERSLLCPNFIDSQQSRNFSSATPPKEPKIKVPLALYGGTGNYASALFIAAAKAKALDKVESELLDLVAATKKSPTFSQFLKDLTVPRDTRAKAISEICHEAKFSKITKNFLVLLAENGRLKYVDTIVKRFSNLTMAHRGEIQAIVTTVIPLPAQEEKELIDTLQEILGKGKKVKLELKIDPSILGGIVLEFDQKVFDMSIKTRAKQMERFLRGNFDA